MKFYISADMEGISGVVSIEEIEPGNNGYERARKLMAREVNVVVDALFAQGASEVYVNDSHNNMTNILRDDLDQRAKLISGSPKPLTMMQGIDDSFAAVLFVGYHARPGSQQAVIDHNYTFRVLEVKINGQPVGEAGLNGRVAGYYHVPVAFISGDRTTVDTAAEELNNPVGVAVKEGINRTSAVIYPFSEVKEKLYQGVVQSLKKLDAINPTLEEGPFELEVSFSLAAMADMCQLIPGVERKEGRTVSYRSENFIDVFNIFRVMLALTLGIR